MRNCNKEEHMQLYDELVARGLIAQVTNEKEIREMINNGRAVFISALIPRRTACMWDILWRCA